MVVEAARTLRTIPGRNLSKADLRVVRIGSRTLAVKDYRSRPFLIRHTLGRLLVRRECRAYGAAAGVGGLPEFLGRIDAFALATAWIESTPLSSLGARPLPSGVFDRLEEIVRRLHDRGVALSDLHHRDVLLAPDGGVFVVDLATAVFAPVGARPRRSSLFEKMKAQDRLALARIRGRFSGRSEAEALSSVDPTAVRRYAAGRRIKALWDAVRGKGA
jgi:hypothetical protein